MSAETKVRACDRCGCTDDEGCEMGQGLGGGTLTCYWAVGDICSNCATPDELYEANCGPEDRA